MAEQKLQNILKDKVALMNIFCVILTVILFSIYDFIPQFKEAARLKTKNDLLILEHKSLTEEQKKRQKKLAEIKLARVNEDLEILTNIAKELKDKIISEKNVPLATLEIEKLATTMIAFSIPGGSWRF